jgi:hypothetical protein
MATGFIYELDDTQPHDEPVVQKDGPTAGKENKRSLMSPFLPSAHN